MVKVEVYRNRINSEDEFFTQNHKLENMSAKEFISKGKLVVVRMKLVENTKRVRRKIEKVKELKNKVG